MSIWVDDVSPDIKIVEDGPDIRIEIVEGVINEGGEGASDHRELTNRDAVDQHPMSSITGLGTALSEKADTSAIPDISGLVESVVAGDGITVDATDPTAPVVKADVSAIPTTAADVGAVAAVVAGPNIIVDSTDPQNPIVSASDDGYRVHFLLGGM